jgi:predicted protein tyrosine phosphatase
LSASFWLENEPSHWDALVILDSKATATDFVQSHTRRHLFLRFDDIEHATEGRRLVTSDQVAQGLEFAIGSKRLLVSCRAGQSRSAAMAYLIACRGGSVEVALSLIDPTRHIPNPLVVRLGTALLDVSDALDAFERWRADRRHIALSDYCDDLEREFDQLVGRGATNRIIDE